MEPILRSFGLDTTTLSSTGKSDSSLVHSSNQHCQSGELPPADYYVPALNVYKCALLWYYSRNTKRDFAISSDPIPAHFFDSATTCPYVTGVTFDPRAPGITKDFILSLADDFLPSNSTVPYYSIQVSVQTDPITHEAVDPELAAAFAVLKSEHQKWKVEPHLIMDYDIAGLGVPELNRDDVEHLEIPSAGADTYQEFETFEKICADAFEYDYIPEITAAHLSMGQTNSLEHTPVSYVRMMVRRKSDQVVVGVGSYMLAKGLDIAYIAEIAVHPECQKRGYGQYVINMILRCLAQQGVNRAMLASTPSGIALYLKVGFKTVPDCATMMITSKKTKAPS